MRTFARGYIRQLELKHGNYFWDNGFDVFGGGGYIAPAQPEHLIHRLPNRMLARLPVLKEHVTLGAVVPEFGAQLGFVARRLFSKGLVRALVGASLWHGGCALLLWH